jgi:hypothetical protein
MHPTLIRAPFHRPRLGLRVYVEKVDGWRIVAYKDRDRGRLVSRNGVDHTRRVRDLAATITKLSAGPWCSTARSPSTTSSSARGSTG